MMKLSIVILIIVNMFVIVLYAGNINCTKVGEWGTDKYKDVFIQGTYAYCAAEEAGLDIIDVGNPTAPKKIGNFDTLFARKVWVNGNNKHAYLADTSELKIIDVSVPSAPKLLGSYAPNLLVKDVMVNGNDAFLIGSISSPDFFGAGEFQVLNIANPAAPVLVGKYQTDVISSFYIDNRYAYLTAYYYDQLNIMHSHLDIVDFSNPSSPQRVGTLALEESDIKGISMKGNYVYLGGSKLYIINVSDPASPYPVGNTAVTGYNVNDIYVNGNYAYVAAGNRGLDIFNISGSAAPALVKNCETPGFAQGVYVQGNYAYIADKEKGLQVVDISDSGSAYIAGKYGGSIAFKSMTISGSHAYLGTSSDGLLIMDISDRTSPIPVGQYQLPLPNYVVYGVQVKGNYAYLADGGHLWDRAFKVFNISDPSSLTLVGAVSSLRCDHVFVNGNYAYTIGDSTELTIVDISIPSHPVVKGSISLDEPAHGIFVSGNNAYIAGESRLMIIDVSNPASPFTTGSLSVNGYLNGVFVRGNYAYAVGKEFYVIDISQPGSPVLVGRCDDLGFQVTVNGNYAFIAASFSGLKAIDISEPTAPTLAGSFSTPGSAQWVDADENYVYVGDTGSGQLFIFEKSFAPHMELDKTELHFAASMSGFKTGPQTILIDKSGIGDLNWQAVSDQTWLSCSPGSGSDAGVITVSIDTTGLNPGTYNGSITVSAPDADNSPQSAAVTLKVYETTQLSGPFGDFGTPGAGSIVQNSVPITGWVLDDIAVANVAIYREEGETLAYIGDAVFIEGARPDVETAFPGYPQNYKAGWGYMMLTNLLPGGGNGPITLHAIATDAEGNQVTLGTRSIICDNAHAVKPFGAIDTPIQGGAISGSNFMNWGWVLTPAPNMVPTDGSTIDVWIDGVKRGHPIYNINRPDIASLFPNYPNSGGAGGYFKFNTTNYSNGIHTIAWSAEDNAGNTDGIGSRYFSVQKIAADQDAPSISTPKTSLGYTTYSFAQVTEIPSQIPGPVMIKKGFRKDAETQILDCNEHGFIAVELKELEPVEIRLSEDEFITELTGFMVVNGQLRPLPIGSTLDINTAVFHWGPGLGFVGNYRLVFILKDPDGKSWKKNVVIMIM